MALPGRFGNIASLTKTLYIKTHRAHRKLMIKGCTRKIFGNTASLTKILYIKTHRTELKTTILNRLP